MKSYHLDQAGSLVGLVLRERDVPRPGPREVLVRMRANSLNARDLGVIYGVRRIPPGAVPVTDGAGSIEALGDGVQRFGIGERVVTTFHPDWPGGPRPPVLRQDLNIVEGMLAEYAVVHEDALVRAPAHLSFEEAATLPCAALAAWNALLATGPLYPSDNVLVQGSGGVSVFALQFAKCFGARVIATSSSADKLARLRQLGADEGVNYIDEPDWEVPVRRLTGGRGVDVVVEVACDMARTLKCVRNGARISILSRLAGAALDVSMVALIGRHITVYGVGTGSRDDMEAMNRAIVQHRLHPVIDRVFPFAEAKEAYRHLERRAHFGKIVISHA
jgi:NADPH:quinone reductase-like Zn-dependent oxidoreductase